MVGRYPANELTGRGPIPRRVRFPASPMRGWRSIRYYPRFPEAIPVRGAGCPRVTQPFATLCTPGGALTVRLACVKRAASVHPEPGSNSPFKLTRRVPGKVSIRTSVRLGRSDPLIWIHEFVEKEIFRMVSRRVSPGRSQFASLSSSISSIAVSGFQGSPRGSPPRKEVLYAPRGPHGATIATYTIPPQFMRA